MMKESMVSLASPADEHHILDVLHQGNVSLDQLENPGHELLVRRSVRRWGAFVSDGWLFVCKKSRMFFFLNPNCQLFLP